MFDASGAPLFSISTRGKAPWTGEEDAKILADRKRGRAFLAIGLELKRSERAVRRRFEVLEADRAWKAVNADERRAFLDRNHARALRPA